VVIVGTYMQLSMFRTVISPHRSPPVTSANIPMMSFTIVRMSASITKNLEQGESIGREFRMPH